MNNKFPYPFLPLFAFFFFVNKAQTQSDLFFSEYVEGSGNNKCLELYNPTNAAINLSGYTIEIYDNGNSSPVGTPWALSGVVPPMGTFVLCSGLAGGALQSIEDGHFGFGSFNGNDAIALKNNGRTLDVFGAIGCDPGDAWTGGGLSTKDRTLVRKSCILKGNSGSGCGFSALSSEWIGFPQDDFSHLGSHDSGIPSVEIQGPSALCANPSIQLTVSGSFSSYKWSTGSTTNSTTVTKAGNYSITVTTSEGCTATANKNINGTSPAIRIEISNIKEPSCSPKKDGSFKINASGGAGGFSYDWGEGAQSSSTVRNIGSGTYTVTATDRNGCTETVKVTINAPILVPLEPPIISNETCKDRKDGTITLNATGGQGALRYSINGGASFQGSGYFDQLPPGNYLAQVIDATGCGDQRLISIARGSQFTLGDTRVSQEKCAGDGGGQILLSPSGGQAPYTYSLNDGAFTHSPVFSNLAAGNHKIIVKDANNCEKAFEQIIEAGSDLVAAFEAEGVTCAGKMDGIIHIVRTGGVGYVSYYIDDDIRPYFNKTEFANLSAGWHKVRVRDQKECIIEEEILIGQKATFDKMLTVQAETCTGAKDGQIKISPSDENAAYEYSLDGQNFQKENIFKNLAPDTYTVFTKGEADCIIIDTVSILVGTLPEIEAVNIKNITCNGGSDGQLTLEASGRNEPFQYRLNNGDFQSSNTFSELQEGDYTITIRDANNCEVSAMASIEEPLSFEATCEALRHLSSPNGRDGAAKVTVSGGSSPYNMQLLNANFNNIISIDGVETFNNLPSGDYTVEVTDDEGCKTTCSFTIEKPACNILVHTSIVDAQCFGNQNGSIFLTIENALEPLVFDWKREGLDGQKNPSGLSAGTYEVTVSDQENCSKSATIIVQEPAPLAVKIVAQDSIFCEKDAIILEVTANYDSYLWSNGATTSEVVIYESGFYSVTISNEVGCIAVDTFEVSTVSQDTIYKTSYVCEADQVGLVELMQRGEDDCADILFTRFELAKKDTTFLETTTCNSDLAGITTRTLPNQYSCDSLIITETRLLPSDTTFLMEMVCNAAETGIFYTVLGNQFDCDSLIITEKMIDPARATILIQTDCNIANLGRDTLVYTDQFNCDSLVILETLLDETVDITLLSATSCETALVGIDTLFLKNNQNCDSLVITATTLDPSNVIFLEENTCDSASAGIDTLFFTNRFLCDSLVIINTTLLESHFVVLNETTCNPQDTGIFILELLNQYNCDSIVQRNVNIAPLKDCLVIFSVFAENLCEGDENGQIEILATSGAAPYHYFLLNENRDTLEKGIISSNEDIYFIRNLSVGNYVVILENEAGAVSKNVTIPEFDNKVDLGADITIDLGDSLTLKPIANFDINRYEWTASSPINCSGCPEINIKPLTNQRYQLIAYNANDCPISDEILVKVRKDAIVYIPSAFSPNDDGVNDYFQIYASPAIQLIKSFQIVDYEGRLMYQVKNTHSANLPEGWDGFFKGQPMTPAVFIVFVEVILIDGTEAQFVKTMNLVR